MAVIETSVEIARPPGEAFAYVTAVRPSLEVAASKAQQQSSGERRQGDTDCRPSRSPPRPARWMAAHFDHAGVTGSAGRFPQSGRNPMLRMFTVHGRFHALTISHSGVRTRVTLAPPRRARVPPPISSPDTAHQAEGPGVHAPRRWASWDCGSQTTRRYSAASSMIAVTAASLSGDQLRCMIT